MLLKMNRGLVSFSHGIPILFLVVPVVPVLPVAADGAADVDDAVVENESGIGKFLTRNSVIIFSSPC